MSNSGTSGALAILASGGPAPGINAVIAAATIRARLEGIPVFGVREGFSRLMVGDSDATTPLDIDDVARIHLRGGSVLGVYGMLISIPVAACLKIMLSDVVIPKLREMGTRPRAGTPLT